MLALNSVAPDFDLPDQHGDTVLSMSRAYLLSPL